MTEREYGQIFSRLDRMEQEIERLRTWRHDLANELAKMSAPLQIEIVEIKAMLTAMKDRSTTIGENRSLTMRDFYIAAASISSGFLAALWLAHH